MVCRAVAPLGRVEPTKNAGQNVVKCLPPRTNTCPRSPRTTITSYTLEPVSATILSNASSLSLATPKYDRAQLTLAGGFNGRDGVFRFLQDGRSEYALVIKKVSVGGAQLVDGAKL